MGDQRTGISGSVAGLIAAGAFLIGGLGGIGVGCSIASAPTASRPSAPDMSGLSDYRSASAAPTTTTAPAVAPTPADFRVDVVVTEQKCFGSAGCNYRLNVSPLQISATDITGKWTVVYEITGGDDPQTGNFTVDGDQIRWDDEKRIQGSAGALFTARVTGVVRAY